MCVLGLLRRSVSPEFFNVAVDADLIVASFRFSFSAELLRISVDFAGSVDVSFESL